MAEAYPINQDELEKVPDLLDEADREKFGKISQQIRDFLVNIGQDSQITSLTIEQKNAQKIALGVNSDSFAYMKSANGPPRDGQVVDEDFQTILTEHLNALLPNKRDVIQTVEFSFANNPELFELIRSNVLEGREPLKIEQLEMSVSNEQQILAILPNIEAKTLEFLRIKGPSTGHRRPADLKEVVELAQWKMAKQLKMNDHVIQNRLGELNLEEKTVVNIFMESLSGKEVNAVKQKFLSDPLHVDWRISYKSFEKSNQDEWNLKEGDLYFRVPNSEDVIWVSHKKPAFFFSRIGDVLVPEGAEII